MFPFFMLSVKLWLHLTVLISLYCLTAYFIEAVKVSNGSLNYWWEKCVYPQIHKNKLAFKNKAFKVKNLTLELLRVGRLPPFTLKVKWFLNSLYSMNKVYSFVFILGLGYIHVPLKQNSNIFVKFSVLKDPQSLDIC